MAVYTKNVGRAIIKHVGNYDSARDYVPLELVYHDGSTYCCKEPTTGNAPPNASYWILMSTSACTLDKQAAEAAAAAAQGSANDAAAQVTAAQQQVTLAQGHANTASTKATEATNKATDAANSASQAQGHAGDAEQSATEAASSASSAAGSATQAQQAASSVNGPALQNQLDNHKHDGTAGNGVMINYADLTGTPDIAAGKNLLHNWDFRNPVNQRGASGAISTAGYFYDRWLLNSGTVTTNADYLTIGAAAEIEQRIEGNLLAGETVTVSVMVGGTVYTGTGIMPTSGTASVTLTGWGTATLGYATGYTYLRLSPTAASNVQAAKLELGTVSTLAYDPPMDYGVELAKCQRFFYMLKPLVNYSFDLAVRALSATEAKGVIFIPSTMRITPSVLFSNVHVDGSPATSMTVLSMVNASVFIQYTRTGGMTAYNWVSVVFREFGSYISLSADL